MGQIRWDVSDLELESEMLFTQDLCITPKFVDHFGPVDSRFWQIMILFCDAEENASLAQAC
jgi:hypothetical protein